MRVRLKRLAVVDQSTLRMLSPRSVASYLNPDEGMLIPDALVYEASKQCSLEWFRGRLPADMSRVFHAARWQTIHVLYESPTKSPADHQIIIHDAMTDDLRTTVRKGGASWNPLSIAAICNEVESRETAFVRNVKSQKLAAGHAGNFALSQIRTEVSSGATVEERCDRLSRFVCGPYGNRIVASHVLAQDSTLDPLEWRGALESHPHRFAIDRWFRILLWYTMLDLMDIHPVDNGDLRDAEYALTASYSGLLLTGDKWLASTCKALFPNVEVKYMKR